MNIGNKQIQIKNIEDCSSIKILKLEDVFEISSQENVYEYLLMLFKYEKEFQKINVN